MEETENKYEDDAEKKDDDEAAEVERCPVAGPEDPQQPHWAPAGAAQPLTSGRADTERNILSEI